MSLISIQEQQFKGLKSKEKLKILEVLETLGDQPTIKKLMDHIDFVSDGGVAHSLIGFYLHQSLSDTDWFASVLSKVGQQLKEGKEAGLKSDTYSEHGFESKEGCLGSDQSSVWMRVTKQMIKTPSAHVQRCFELLLNSPIHFSPTYINVEEMELEKLPGFGLKSTDNNYWTPVDVFLSMQRVDLAALVWDKNAKKKQFTQRADELISRSLVRGYTYGDHRGSSEPFRGIYMSEMSQWSRGGKMLSFLTSKSTQTDSPNTSYVATIFKVLLSGDPSVLNETQTLLAQKFMGSETWFDVMGQLFYSEHSKDKGFLEKFENRDQKMQWIEKSFEQDYAVAFKSVLEAPLNPNQTLSAQHRSMNTERLKTLESLALYAPKEFAAKIWEKTPAHILAIAFSKNSPITDTVVKRVCDCANKVDKEVLTDVLVAWSSALNVFPTTHDRSPFHALITELPCDVLERFLEKMHQQQPRYLGLLLSEQCWTLQHLDLRKKGDAFCVAIGDGDPEKLRVLLQYAEHQNKERAKETLKYLKARDKQQHAKALSAFELLLFEKAVSQELSTSASPDTEKGGTTKKAKMRL